MLPPPVLGSSFTARRAVATLVAALLYGAAFAPLAGAWVVLPSAAVGDPPCPAVPDAADVELTTEERGRIDSGEIVVRVLRQADRGALVQAVGYLDANPAWLFELATDPEFATRLTGHADEVHVLETRADGKRMRCLTDPSMLMPTFEYTLTVSHLDDSTGQCWAQVEGDFDKNEGSHSYLWDPVRGQTLAVFTIEVGLKGMLRMLPQPMVVRMTARTLPDYMRSLERMAAHASLQDPKRAQRVDERWISLRARLESGELARRVWPPRTPPTETAAIRSAQASVASR